jgi:hypothetical protein
MHDTLASLNDTTFHPVYQRQVWYVRLLSSRKTKSRFGPSTPPHEPLGRSILRSVRSGDDNRKLRHTLVFSLTQVQVVLKAGWDDHFPYLVFQSTML